MVVMVGDRNPFGDFEVGEGVVDSFEGVAEDTEKEAAGFFASANGDEDFLVFRIGFDSSDVVGFVVFLVLQHYATAPVGMVVDAIVGDDDETRDDAFGENFVMILKFEGFAF